MAQVSFPGVYVVEVPSGVQTITGVATSIAAFVGMSRQGPLSAPTTVLSFTDYVRTFSADTSFGEMTDQVQQFFQNGGQQAVVVRVAHNASTSASTLTNASGVGVLTLTALSAGTDGRQIRAAVDYDTASPERTFNLTIFRETLDPSGNPIVSATEVYSNVSVDPSDPRLVTTVVNQASALVAASFPTGLTPPSTPAYSMGALLGVSDATNTSTQNYIAAVNAILPANHTGSFQIRVGNLGVQPISIMTTAAGGWDATTLPAAINSAISTAYGSAVATASIVTQGPLATAGQTTTLAGLVITAAAAGQDVILTPSTSNDIAVPLGLGVAQGGVELGAFAAADLRPRPSGFVSVVDGEVNMATPLPDALLQFGLVQAADFATLKVTQTNPAATFNLQQSTTPVDFPATSILATGTNKGGSLLNIRENLTALVGAINSIQTAWRAKLQGYRLALQPAFGPSTTGAGASIAATQGTWTTLTSSIFGALASSQSAAFPLLGGSDGAAPNLDDYKAAFTAIDANVDLFNIMVLPRTAGTNAGDRVTLGVWSAASTFCLQKRAFLLVDADATNVTAVLPENAKLRVGMVKDHAALYWPHVIIPDGNGFTKTIDPSGSIAGIMARIDSTRGVWKAPAGLEADVRGISGVDVLMSDAQNGLINPQAVNAIRSFPNGIVSWGARTMDGFDNSGDTDFKYVPVRRFELFLEESLVRGLKFAVFEPNAEPLWAQIRLAVGAFLNTLFRAGAFAGTSPQTSYFVKVDSETTTQNDINLGIVNVLVGFAPLKPAEFIVITIRQLAGQIQV